MEGKFEKLENPFSWKLDELDFNDILVRIEHKTEELCQDDWRVYVNRLLFCVMYEIVSEHNKCFAELNICKALVNKKKTSYGIIKKYNKAFTLITKITECYLLYKTNRQEEAEMLFEDITAEELDDKNKSAVYAIKTSFLMKFGVEGTEQAIYWSREARNLNFKEPEWHFLFGKTLFRSRHFITPVPEPEQEEVTAFENACEFSKTDDKNVSLAAVHYMCMLGICYKDKSKAIFHSDKSKRYTVEVDALNQKSSELMYKSRKLNDSRCHHLSLRISRTLFCLPFPYGDKDLAARDLKILLEKVPTNAFFNHSVAMLHIQQKQWRDAYKYLQLASDLKCFPASMTLLSFFKKWRNESFNIVEHFALFLKMYTNPIQQKQINSYVGIYYLLFTDDLITSLRYLEKAFDLDKGVLSLREYKFNPFGPCFNLYQLMLNEIKVSIEKKKYKNAEELKVYKKLLIKIINTDEQLEVIQVKYGWVKEILEQSIINEKEFWSKTTSTDEISTIKKLDKSNDRVSNFINNLNEIDDNELCQQLLSDLQPRSTLTSNEIEVPNFSNSKQSTTNHSIDEKKEIHASPSGNTFLKENKENKLKNKEEKSSNRYLSKIKGENYGRSKIKEENYSSANSSDYSYPPEYTPIPLPRSTQPRETRHSNEQEPKTNKEEIQNTTESVSNFMNNLNKIVDSGLCQQLLSGFQPFSTSTNEIEVLNSSNSKQSATNYSIDEKKEFDKLPSGDTFIKKNKRYKENKLKKKERKDLRNKKSSNSNLNTNTEINSDSGSSSDYLIRNDNRTVSKTNETTTHKVLLNKEIDTTISHDNKNKGGNFNRNNKQNRDYERQATNENTKPLPRSKQPRETRHSNEQEPKNNKEKTQNTNLSISKFTNNLTGVVGSGLGQQLLPNLSFGSTSTTNVDVLNSPNSKQSTTNHSVVEKKEVNRSRSGNTFIKRNKGYKENKLQCKREQNLRHAKSNRNVNGNKEINYSSDSSSDDNYLSRNDNRTVGKINETKTRKDQQNEEIDSTVSHTNKNEGKFNRNDKHNCKGQAANENTPQPLPRETRHSNEQGPKHNKKETQNTNVTVSNLTNNLIKEVDSGLCQDLLSVLSALAEVSNSSISKQSPTNHTINEKKEGNSSSGDTFMKKNGRYKENKLKNKEGKDLRNKKSSNSILNTNTEIGGENSSGPSYLTKNDNRTVSKVNEIKTHKVRLNEEIDPTTSSTNKNKGKFNRNSKQNCNYEGQATNESMPKPSREKRDEQGPKINLDEIQNTAVNVSNFTNNLTRIVGLGQQLLPNLPSVSTSTSNEVDVSNTSILNIVQQIIFPAKKKK